MGCLSTYLARRPRFLLARRSSWPWLAAPSANLLSPSPALASWQLGNLVIPSTGHQLAALWSRLDPSTLQSLPPSFASSSCRSHTWPWSQLGHLGHITSGQASPTSRHLENKSRQIVSVTPVYATCSSTAGSSWTDWPMPILLVEWPHSPILGNSIIHGLSLVGASVVSEQPRADLAQHAAHRISASSSSFHGCLPPPGHSRGPACWPSSPARPSPRPRHRHHQSLPRWLHPTRCYQSQNPPRWTH